MAQRLIDAGAERAAHGGVVPGLSFKSGRNCGAAPERARWHPASDHWQTLPAAGSSSGGSLSPRQREHATSRSTSQSLIRAERLHLCHGSMVGRGRQPAVTGYGVAISQGDSGERQGGELLCSRPIFRATAAGAGFSGGHLPSNCRLQGLSERLQRKRWYYC